MKVITVPELVGVPKPHRHDFYEAMRRCTNGQRLAVCLFLMSDLPDARHHLSDIEANHAQIFPPSLGQGLTPQEYVDFQASAIRRYFNEETILVRSGVMRSQDRLWAHPQRGHWRNTEIGNATALDILRKQSVLVQRDGSVINAESIVLPEVSRPYLEEELLETIEDEPEQSLEEEAAAENLLAHVDRILASLPQIDAARLPDALGAIVRISGTPDEVARVLRPMLDSFTCVKIEMRLTYDQHGWRVTVACNE